MDYTEEREFTLRLELRCTFPDDYQGEEDGFLWLSQFPAMAAEIVRAAQHIAAKQPGWTVRAANRGRSSQDEVTLVLERTPQ